MNILKSTVTAFIVVILSFSFVACSNNSIVGIWETKTEDENIVTFEFTEDKKFKQSTKDYDGNDVRLGGGTYKIDGNKLLIWDITTGTDEDVVDAEAEAVFEIKGDKMTLTVTDNSHEHGEGEESHDHRVQIIELNRK